MQGNILVLIPVDDRHKRLLEGKVSSAVFTYAARESVTASQVREADIIIGNPPVSMITGSKKLKWLQLTSAGAEAYVKGGVIPDGAVLTNASGAYGLAVSEYMLSVVLELYKKLHLYRDNQLKADWSNLGSVKSIYGSTALIIGAGDIGGDFANKIKALGGHTIGIRRSNASKPDYLDEVYSMDSLETLLPRADIVTLSLPGTGFTYRIMNRATLMIMKQDAVLINVGRGSAVDTEDLCDALENGRLLGAALDVTDPEPLPKDHRLWNIKNAVITPHVAGGFGLQETFERVVAICASNLEAYSSGKDLRNLVDLSAGY